MHLCAGPDSLLTNPVRTPQKGVQKGSKIGYPTWVSTPDLTHQGSDLDPMRSSEEVLGRSSGRSQRLDPPEITGFDPFFDPFWGLLEGSNQVVPVYIHGLVNGGIAQEWGLGAPLICGPFSPLPYQITRRITDPKTEPEGSNPWIWDLGSYPPR